MAYCKVDFEKITFTLTIIFKITRSWPAGVKFQPVQPGQTSTYDYMGKLKFILVRQDFSTWYLFKFCLTLVFSFVYSFFIK